MSDFLTNLGSTAEAAGKGAAALSFLGPIGMAAGAALNAGLELGGIDLSKVIAAHPETAATVVSVVNAATGGATDPATAIANDPGLAADLRVQLAQIITAHEEAMQTEDTEQLKAMLSDTDAARQATANLAKVGTPIAWGAPAISVVAVIGFFASFFILLFVKLPTDQGFQALIYTIVGTISAGFTATLNYWIGSSRGSDTKTSLIANMKPDSSTPSS